MILSGLRLYVGVEFLIQLGRFAVKLYFSDIKTRDFSCLLALLETGFEKFTQVELEGVLGLLVPPHRRGFIRFLTVNKL